MNRKERRANRKQESREHEAIARTSGNAGLLTLASDHQEQGRPREAVKLLKQILAREPGNAAAHDHIAMAYQAFGRRDDAVHHFSQAISFGLRDIDSLVRQSPVMIAALGRFARTYPARLPLAELLGSENAVADDIRLLGLLQSELVRDIETELFLTAIRRELLDAQTGEKPLELADNVLDLACAVAQQCFLTEYVYALSDAERGLAAQLKDRVAQTGAASAPADIAVLGCYLPLRSLPDAAKLLDRRWPKPVDTLLTRQVREPLAEAADISAIPALTAVEGKTSEMVQQQYEESPYPRWTVALPTRPTTFEAYLRERFGVTGASGDEILIAGCGTGEQSINNAQTFPQSKVLAIDISRTSLAYARRRTRELGVRNIEYAQADILKLGSIGRSFDFIESVGVLHHMAEPEAGWRSLLSLLRPGGVMRIALYSTLGRRSLDTGRALIAERGYGPTIDDIRAWRQELIQRCEAIYSLDFHSTSSCRDLCFHVMEHRFTLPRIKQFLEANRLTMLGMETNPDTQQKFLLEHPEPGAQTDLDAWDAFEQRHPGTFSNMYYLWLRSS
jgi:SAM-dependent methyltransferase